MYGPQTPGVKRGNTDHYNLKLAYTFPSQGPEDRNRHWGPNESPTGRYNPGREARSRTEGSEKRGRGRGRPKEDPVVPRGHRGLPMEGGENNGQHSKSSKTQRIGEERGRGEEDGEKTKTLAERGHRLPGQDRGKGQASRWGTSTDAMCATQTQTEAATRRHKEGEAMERPASKELQPSVRPTAVPNI
ncbi:unnamed protein product [Prunus armeniaca]|uniref:Uncharacterized protein n=1 Tax=Prunus armeniaca TaxID=36596 RepID=A0A6J5X9E2_PRUAR|nr:unnamed protein product [Prunus armeniaca]